MVSRSVNRMDAGKNKNTVQDVADQIFQPLWMAAIPPVRLR